MKREMDASKILRTSGVLKEYSREKYAQKLVKKLDEKTIRLLAKSILEFSTIPALLELVKDNADYKKILRLVKHSFKTKKIERQLFGIYEKRKRRAKNYLVKLIEKLEVDAYGEKTIAQIRALEKSSRLDKLSIIDTIKKGKDKGILQLPKTDERRKAFDSYVRVKWIFDQVNGSELPFDNEDFKRKIKGGDDTKYIAYKIYDPLWWHDVFRYEEDFQKKFPYKWVLELSLDEIRRLYELFKKNRLPKNPFLARYDKKYLNELLRNLTDPLLPQIGIRKRFIKQAFDNYLQGNYAACINLLLPLIEGLIWQHSVYLHNRGLRIYNANKVDIKSRLTYKLITKDGEVIRSDQSLKLLLTKTNLGDEIPSELIEHFCNELYQERNLILHGIDLAYDTKISCANKLLVLEHIYKIIFKRIVNDVEYFLKRKRLPIRK